MEDGQIKLLQNLAKASGGWWSWTKGDLPCFITLDNWQNIYMARYSESHHKLDNYDIVRLRFKKLIIGKIMKKSQKHISIDDIQTSQLTDLSVSEQKNICGGFTDRSSTGFTDRSSTGFTDRSSTGFTDRSSTGFSSWTF